MVKDEKQKDVSTNLTKERIESGLLTAILAAATGTVLAGPVGAVFGAVIGSASGSVGFSFFEHHKKEESGEEGEGKDG